MPIIEDLKLSENSRLIIWEISETINELKTKVLLSENSLKLLNQRKSEVQKKQFLAIRNILSELSIDDRDMKYEESGRPYVIGGQNISLSHSDTFAAVILSDNVVGIDIEIMNDRILKIKDKFKDTVGKTLNVLTEKNSFGYSENYLKVKISNKNFLKEGQIIPAQIIGYKPNYLEAII